MNVHNSVDSFALKVKVAINSQNDKTVKLPQRHCLKQL